MTTRAFRLVLLLALAGCARKEPSPEFTRASERFNKLYAKELDDAYVDPAMHEVEALLDKVPADSLDAQAAAQLLSRIRENRARIEQAAREREKAMADARTPPTLTGPSVSPPPPPPGGSGSARPPAPPAPDAGPPAAPSAGMAMRDFNRLFGDCFEPAGPVEVNGRGTRDSYAMVDSDRCRRAMPGLTNSVVLADSQTVMGVIPKAALQRTLVDGGAPTPAPPDAGS
ncbi:MAG TPA: hypothetical protein VMH40_20135 [Myxococcaceae bacterium]|nr:hypothetical protein [Myxococcaceae bacterium]